MNCVIISRLVDFSTIFCTSFPASTSSKFKKTLANRRLRPLRLHLSHQIKGGDSKGHSRQVNRREKGILVQPVRVTVQPKRPAGAGEFMLHPSGRGHGDSRIHKEEEKYQTRNAKEYFWLRMHNRIISGKEMAFSCSWNYGYHSASGAISTFFTVFPSSHFGARRTAIRTFPACPFIGTSSRLTPVFDFCGGCCSADSMANCEPLGERIRAVSSFPFRRRSAVSPRSVMSASVVIAHVMSEDPASSNSSCTSAAFRFPTIATPRRTLFATGTYAEEMSIITCAA